MTRVPAFVEDSREQPAVSLLRVRCTRHEGRLAHGGVRPCVPERHVARVEIEVPDRTMERIVGAGTTHSSEVTMPVPLTHPAFVDAWILADDLTEARVGQT